MIKINKIILLSLCMLSTGTVKAQQTVAIGDFENDSEAFYLDSWEKSIPEFLKSELSKTTDLLVVERQQLESVLKEQALSMTGLIDSTTAQTVGQMIGAQYIISGKITKVGKWIRIDARIIQTSTGLVKSEKVRGPDHQHLQEMIGLLANNIGTLLTGNGKRQDGLVIHQYPTYYFLGAALTFGIGAVLVNNEYQENLDRYRKTVALSEFDDRYDQANQWHQARTVMISLSVTAAAGALYCWIRNLSPEKILASRSDSGGRVIPALVLNNEGNFSAGFTIRF
jgi:TolB-like protein